MSNPNVSNGTCYTNENSKAKGDFIPCGNVEFGNWPCCLAGNVCLNFQEANACWDYGTGNTYVAGCTDLNYVDKTCPQKHKQFDDQEWVGLYQCSGSGNNTNWGGCENSPADVATMIQNPLASCTPYCTSTLFVGSSSLPAYATVPSTAGGSITWTNGFNPTSTSRPPGTPPDPTDASTLSGKSDRNGLSTGAEAGIGVACAVVGILIISALVALLFRRRKTAKARAFQQQQQHPGNGPYSEHYQGQSPPYPGIPPIPMASFPGGSVPDQPWQYVPATQPYWVADANGKDNNPQDSTVYTGFKHELPAENLDENQDKSQAGSPRPSTIAPSSTGVSTMSTTNHDLQRQNGGWIITPQSTGTSGHFQENFGLSNLGSVSELGGPNAHTEGRISHGSPQP